MNFLQKSFHTAFLQASHNFLVSQPSSTVSISLNPAVVLACLMKFWFLSLYTLQCKSEISDVSNVSRSVKVVVEENNNVPTSFSGTYIYLHVFIMNYSIHNLKNYRFKANNAYLS
jgi:hypothetical protein